MYKTIWAESYLHQGFQLNHTIIRVFKIYSQSNENISQTCNYITIQFVLKACQKGNRGGDKIWYFGLKHFNKGNQFWASLQNYLLAMGCHTIAMPLWGYAKLDHLSTPKSHRDSEAAPSLLQCQWSDKFTFSCLLHKLCHESRKSGHFRVEGLFWNAGYCAYRY